MEPLNREAPGPSPEREASFFYGLFLRGHSLNNLRNDIDVSSDVISYWETMLNHDPWYHEALYLMVPFRKKVLAIFNSLVDSAVDPVHQ